MKTLTTAELDTEMAAMLQESITGLENLELMDIEIARLSEDLDLNESIEQEDELFNQAAKNLGFNYLIEEV